MLLFLAFVPRVGMVAQSMRMQSHIRRLAHNRGRHVLVLVVVVGEPLNSSGLPVVPTSLQDTGAHDVEKLAGSVGCAAGPRRRDFHRSESGHGPGSRSVEMEVAVGAGPLSSGHRRDPMLETRLYHQRPELARLSFTHRRLHQALPNCPAQIRPVHRGFVVTNRGNDIRDEPAAECYPAAPAARLELVAKSSSSSTDHWS
jgi:hypothetical protein